MGSSHIRLTSYRKTLAIYKLKLFTYMHQSTQDNKKIKLVFMVNINLISGGGMERTLLSFIKYIPDEFKSVFDIKVIQTGIYDKIRISH